MYEYVAIEKPVQNARHFLEAFGNHDVEAMLSVCSQNARLHFVPMGPAGRGRVDGLGRAFWLTLFDAIPNVEIKINRVDGHGAHVVSEVAIKGTQQKDYLGIGTMGKDLELQQAFHFRINGSAAITDVTVYWDNATLFSQLGMPCPHHDGWEQKVLDDCLRRHGSVGADEE